MKKRDRAPKNEVPGIGQRRKETGKVVARTVLCLLAGGVVLGILAVAPGFTLAFGARKQRKPWRQFEPRRLRESVKRLEKQGDVSIRDHKDGSATVELTEKGKKRALRFRLNELSIVKPATWDRTWRLLVFDIPERFKKGREALRFHLKKLGFRQLQRSVFIHPYPCKEEIDFLVGFHGLHGYVHLFYVPDTGETAWVHEVFKTSL